MKHRNCGGLVVEDLSLSYIYEDCEGIQIRHGLRCQKCRQEIIGDREIDTGVPEIEQQYEEVK